MYQPGILMRVNKSHHYRILLSDMDFMDSADMPEDRESLMHLTVSLTGRRSIARYIESSLSPIVSRNVLATAAFSNSLLKCNTSRYPRSCLSLKTSLIKGSKALNDVRSFVGLFIVLLNK